METHPINIVLGLHAYQPPTQWPEVTTQINRESYAPVARALLQAPEGAVLCADIALSLLEQLEKIGCQETIELFRQAINAGKLHLVNTAAYHPLLPLVPDYYIERQLVRNAAGYEKYFGIKAEKVAGLFPPEMAFTEKMLEPVKTAGASWLVIDDTTFGTHHRQSPPFNRILKKSGISVLFMSHTWHKMAAFGEIRNGRHFLDALHYGYRMWTGNQPSYVILWMDWETFGHHDKKPAPPQDRIGDFLIPFLQTAVRDERFRITTPEQLIAQFPVIENVFIPDGSWSTTSDDYFNGVAWPLWLNPRHHRFHTKWWNLANYTLSVLGNAANKEVSDLVDRALYSCQPWQWVNGNGEIAKEGLVIFHAIFSHPSVSVGIRDRGMQLIEELRNI